MRVRTLPLRCIISLGQFFLASTSSLMQMHDDPTSTFFSISFFFPALAASFLWLLCPSPSRSRSRAPLCTCTALLLPPMRRPSPIPSPPQIRRIPWVWDVPVFFSDKLVLTYIPLLSKQTTFDLA